LKILANHQVLGGECKILRFHVPETICLTDSRPTHDNFLYEFVRIYNKSMVFPILATSISHFMLYHETQKDIIDVVHAINIFLLMGIIWELSAEYYFWHAPSRRINALVY